MVSSSLPGDEDCKADNSGTTDEQSAGGRNIITMHAFISNNLELGIKQRDECCI